MNMRKRLAYYLATWTCTIATLFVMSVNFAFGVDFLGQKPTIMARRKAIVHKKHTLQQKSSEQLIIAESGEHKEAETIPQENETTVREFINEIIDPMFEAFRSRQPVRSVDQRAGKMIRSLIRPAFDTEGNVDRLVIVGSGIDTYYKRYLKSINQAVIVKGHVI